jgi:hypothetical protein
MKLEDLLAAMRKAFTKSLGEAQTSLFVEHVDRNRTAIHLGWTLQQRSVDNGICIFSIVNGVRGSLSECGFCADQADAADAG